MNKPLGIKSYGSIPHLPNSRLGLGDHSVHKGQNRICTVRVRDKHDRVFVEEKLDGSCTAVALKGGRLLALGRAGWPAESSRWVQHQMFAQWVHLNEDRLRAVLQEGERLVGEWLAQAHGTLYDLQGRCPWGVFDILEGSVRLPRDEFYDRVSLGDLPRPNLLHDGEALPVSDAMCVHDAVHWPCDETEGVVYRVERKGRVDFLAKWVRPTKVDGKHLPIVSGLPEVWNWRPPWWKG